MLLDIPLKIFAQRREEHECLQTIFSLPSILSTLSTSSSPASLNSGSISSLLQESSYECYDT